MKIENGTNINQYKILSKIGKGGMGEVYLAEDTKLDRQVALKILPAEFAEDKDRMSRFVREAKSASALNHPNIITIYEIGESENINYIATEFIDGKTLDTYLKDNPLSFNEVLDIAIQVTSALDESHEAGIVHRDIKPDNIMIRENGLVKILDFGIAKLTEKETPEIESEDATAVQQPSTTPGMIIGTANYMSPEQAKGEIVDARTDIFSFGVVLYEIIAGYLPFEGKTPMEIIGAIIHKEPKLFDSEHVPSEIERIVSKALRKDRDERYQTIKDLLIDLKDVKQELEFQDKLEKTVSPDKEEPKTKMFKATTIDDGQQTTTANDSIAIKKSSFNKIGVGVLAMLLISAIGFGYWYFTNESKQIDSIAVMPFVNETGNEDVEYLSDGMTETLISSLSNIPNLSVKARTTVFYYKGKEISPKKIGEELGVQAILLGRLVQRGDDLKLNLELVDTKTQDVIWSENYDRKMNNLVDLQSEIAKEVSEKMRITLSGTESDKILKANTANPEAYQAYLKGRFHWNKLNEEGIEKGIKYFKEAIELDPNYALAWSGLADSYTSLPQNTNTPTMEAIPKAKAAAQKAVALDPESAEARTSLAWAKHYDWDFAGAEREYKAAIKLNPKYSFARLRYGTLLNETGRFDESIKEIKIALELDPLARANSLNLAHFYWINHRLEEANEQFKKNIETFPDYIWNYYYLALSLAQQGKYNEAFSACTKVYELSNGELKLCSASVFAFEGKDEEAEKIISEQKKIEYEDGDFTIAETYAIMNKKDEAFRLIDKLIEKRSYVVKDLATDPTFENLRDDPRYKEVLKKMNFPE